MRTLTLGGFGGLDWAVLGVYFALLVGTGVLFSLRRQRTTGDYFLGGRGMPVWAVAISVLATALSGATFVGGPQQSFTGNLTYLSSNIGMIIAAFIVAIFFIPVFYKLGVATVYGLLGVRFGTPAKLAAGGAFMFGRILASAARVFIAALPASLIVFGDTEPGHLVIVIMALTVVGIAYTLTGGIASVIWTDVIQTVVFVTATIVAIFLLLNRIPAETDLLGVLGEARTPDGESKLLLLSLSTDPSHAFTLWTAIIAFTFMGLASYGTDQDMVQRMLTCKSALRGSLSAIGGVLLAVPTVMLFMAVGLLLYIFYERPDVMGAAAPAVAIDDDRQVFLRFILDEMPAGLTGLMMAGLFAAGLSSVNSTLNSLSSTLIEDFYRRIVRDRPASHYLRAGRIGVVFWGVVLGGFGCFCVYWQARQAEAGGTLIDFALGVMTFAYAGLIAVFCTAIFTKRRGSNASVIAALATGFIGVLLLQGGVLARLAPWLGFDGGDIAWPWRLVIASLLATGVCLLGRSPPCSGIVDHRRISTASAQQDDPQSNNPSP